MEDFYDTSSSQDESYNYNITYDYYDDLTEYEYYIKLEQIYNVVTWMIICIGFPLSLGAIYAVYSQVRNDHVAPVYVINLLIADLFQLCCLPIGLFAQDWAVDYIDHFDSFGFVASVGFMVCVTLKRYLGITWPLWCCFKHTFKTSVVVCVMIWALYPVIFILDHALAAAADPGVFLILSLIMFFLGGALKTLSVPSEEKRRIVRIWVLVLFIYTLLFLPRSIWLLTGEDRHNITFNILSSMFLKLSPLADSGLYVFMRKGAVHKLLASVCSCRMDRNDVSTAAV